MKRAPLQIPAWMEREKSIANIHFYSIKKVKKFFFLGEY